MTSKVVELRGLVIYDLTEYYKTAAVNLGKQAESEATEMADSLISAAHTEGVAEGAEQERERIREASSYMAEGTQADCDQLYVHKEYHQGSEYHVVLVGEDFYMVDPSVLAPTKEVAG